MRSPPQMRPLGLRAAHGHPCSPPRGPGANIPETSGSKPCEVSHTSSRAQLRPLAPADEKNGGKNNPQ